jgi:hypothetical protein
MKSRAKIYEWIDRFNSGDLSEEERVEFNEIMGTSKRVRNEIRMDNDLRTVLLEEDILDLRKQIRGVIVENASAADNNQNLVPLLYLIAASVVLLISFEFAIYHFLRPSLSAMEPVVTKFQKQHFSGKAEQDTFKSTKNGIFRPVIKTGTPEKGNNLRKLATESTLLSSYQPNKALENLVGVITRSTALKMVHPSATAGFTHGRSILFSWEGESHGNTSLVIMNNTGKVVYESDSNNIPTVTLSSSYFASGLYYYKLICNDEIICFRKFTIY